MPPKRKYAESRARYYIREQAAKRGWKTSHIASGGDFVEENEIISTFPDIGLGLDRPDFLACIRGNPAAVIEAKNDAGRSDSAVDQAIGYANAINATGKYCVRVAVGASGNEDQGFVVVVRFLTQHGWMPLRANSFELTNLPSKKEVELAVAAGDATTSITTPSPGEFIEAAIEVSHILRTARVEAPLRPKVIGALVLAMYESALGMEIARNAGSISEGDGGAYHSQAVHHSGVTLERINTLVAFAVDEAVSLAEDRRLDLIEALQLSGAAYQQLEPRLDRIIAILRRLNVRAVMHSGVDFLGAFYEAFLRYGYDNNALGIVFTPRHITRFCVDLVGVNHSDRVIDIACGTGGFLVSAFDEMISSARSEAARCQVKTGIHGYDTNPTVWALALLNMYFRGDGKSNIHRGSSLTRDTRWQISKRFTRSFLNPPFSQKGEPERSFIDAAIEALEPNGLLAVVVKAGVFADDDHRAWRNEFTRRHQVLAVISLPDDLFYPTAAPTSILIARAHVPQAPADHVYLARVSNDGFEKLKGKRVGREGSELPMVVHAFHHVLAGGVVADERSMTVEARSILGGAEWSPQEWLPQTHTAEHVMVRHQDYVAGSILRTVATFPDAGDNLLADFGAAWEALPTLPYGNGQMTLNDAFTVVNGKSSGEKNYAEGDTPYISSGDQANSIVSLVAPVEGEVFENGGITVTAFGQAFVQPWPFMARGNGGSAVRVLLPRYRMSIREMSWFAAQINVQRWRFFYARMAIKSRIVRLTLEVPPHALPDSGSGVAEIARAFLASYHQQLALLRE